MIKKLILVQGLDYLFYGQLNKTVFCFVTDVCPRIHTSLIMAMTYQLVPLIIFLRIIIILNEGVKSVFLWNVFNGQNPTFRQLTIRLRFTSFHFFFSLPAHLCVVTYMTEISLIVTLNNPIHLNSHKFSLKMSNLCFATFRKGECVT